MHAQKIIGKVNWTLQVHCISYDSCSGKIPNRSNRPLSNPKSPYLLQSPANNKNTITTPKYQPPHLLTSSIGPTISIPPCLRLRTPLPAVCQLKRPSWHLAHAASTRWVVCSMALQEPSPVTTALHSRMVVEGVRWWQRWRWVICLHMLLCVGGK